MGCSAPIWAYTPGTGGVLQHPLTPTVVALATLLLWAKAHQPSRRAWRLLDRRCCDTNDWRYWVGVINVRPFGPTEYVSLAGLPLADTQVEVGDATHDKAQDLRLVGVWTRGLQDDSLSGRDGTEKGGHKTNRAELEFFVTDTSAMLQQCIHMFLLLLTYRLACPQPAIESSSIFRRPSDGAFESRICGARQMWWPSP